MDAREFTSIRSGTGAYGIDLRAGPCLRSNVAGWLNFQQLGSLECASEAEAAAQKREIVAASFAPGSSGPALRREREPGIRKHGRFLGYVDATDSEDADSTAHRAGRVASSFATSSNRRTATWRPIYQSRSLRLVPRWEGIQSAHLFAPGKAKSRSSSPPFSPAESPLKLPPEVGLRALVG